MVWLSVLAVPVRSDYATDSAAMLGKALKLIEAAKVYENRQCTIKPSREKTRSGSRGGCKLTETCGNRYGMQFLRGVRPTNK